MNFFAYIYQLKISISNFFYSNKDFTPTHVEAKRTQEINTDVNNNLKFKCKKSILEVQHIKSFTHWPITEAKKR